MASSEHWEDAAAFAPNTRACLLELRARVEALEAARQVQPSTSLAKSMEAACQAQPGTRLVSYSVGPARSLEELGKDHTPVPQAPPADGLVQRVIAAMSCAELSSTWEPEARAAIREVATTARKLRGRLRAPMSWEHVAQWLEQEAER